MAILVIVPLALIGLLLVEWRIRTKWIRILAVLFAMGLVAVLFSWQGQVAGEARVKNMYARHLSTLVTELHRSNERNAHATLSAQIDRIQDRLPRAMLNESELASLVDDVLQMSDRTP